MKRGANGPRQGHTSINCSAALTTHSELMNKMKMIIVLFNMVMNTTAAALALPLQRFHHGHLGRHGHRHSSPPSPPPPPPTPAQPQCGCCELCLLGPHREFLPAPGAGGSTTTAPANCVTSLSVLSSCSGFLTDVAQPAPTPHSPCCRGLAQFLDGATAAADGGRTLRCMCPLITGGALNAMLPKPVDPIRMITYLPIACGIVLPRDLIPLCLNNATTSSVKGVN